MKTKLLFSVFLFCTAQLSFGQWSYSDLTGPKSYMGSTTLGNKAYFAGGRSGSNSLALVEEFDVTTGTWNIIGNLSVARGILSGISCGSKLFFAGGTADWVTSTSTVDIFDTTTQQWSVAQLSVPRFSLAAVSDSIKVLFAGGVQVSPSLSYKSVVDIYDIQTGVWSTANLSLAREGIAAAVVGNLAIFAGGKNGENSTTDVVDIYNFSTNKWSKNKLSQARGFASATTIGSKVIIAGGITSLNNPTKRVDIFDTTTGIWTTANLSVPRASQGNAVTVNGKAYFAGGGIFMGSGFITPSDVVDIYDPVSNTWAIDFLTQPIMAHSVVNVGNRLLVAGGVTNGDVNVDKVEIFTDPTLIRVPTDYPTIQLGINAASDGDTVLVAENIYYENINFKGKAILVASEFITDKDTSHISKTIINGSKPVNPDIGSVVTFESGEDTNSVLCGFTITGGTGTFEPSVNYRVGGGVNIEASGAKLLNNYIRDNTVSHTSVAFGGGIQAGGPVTEIPWVVIQNNKIRNNKALSSGDAGTGGGVAVYYNVIMADNEITQNEANGPSHGGAGGASILGVFGPIQLNIRNNMITENKAVSVSNFSTNTIGGGMVIAFECSGIVSGNVISYNKIESSAGKWGEGAGVLVQEAMANDFVFENNLIANNSYVGERCSGGGMELFNTGGKFRNNVILDNQATDGGGITLNNNFGAAPVLINNTITGNKATTSGGGLNLADAKAVVINTIIWGTAPTAASIYQEGSTLTVKYSDVQGSTLWPGEGNINENPMFPGSGENPFSLSEGSPCIDKGIPDPSGLNLPISDIIGNHRIWDGNADGITRVDIGAYEFGSFLVGIEELIVAGKTISLMNYPNPFTNLTTFTFILEKSANVNIRVFDIFGRLVAEPVNEFHQIGEQNIQWNTEGLPSGLYFCRLKAGNQFITHKIVKM